MVRQTVFVVNINLYKSGTNDDIVKILHTAFTYKNYVLLFIFRFIVTI